MSPAECTARWKAMWDKFVHELKKVKGCKSGDAGPAYSPSLHLGNNHHFYNVDTAIILYTVNTFCIVQIFSFLF